MITVAKLLKGLRSIASLPKPKQTVWVVNEEAHQDLIMATGKAADGSGSFWPALRVYVKPGQIERVRQFETEAEAIEYLEEQ